MLAISTGTILDAPSPPTGINLSGSSPSWSAVRDPGPVVVQHARLDSRQAENALLSTVASPIG